MKKLFGRHLGASSLKFFLYKVCNTSEWNNFIKTGRSNGTKKDKLDGFIHLSRKNQVRKTLIKHFSNKNNLVLLKIDSSNLKNLIWEKSLEGQLFPHLYGNLTLAQVKKNYKIILKNNGQYLLPLKF